MRVLILCLLAVLLILIIYIVVTSDAYRRAEAKKNERLSNGTYDRHARAAARNRRHLREPQAEDFRQQARILRFNLLENQLERAEFDAREAVAEMATLYIGALARVGDPAEAFELVFEAAPILPIPAAQVHKEAVAQAAERIAGAKNKSEAAIEYLQEVQKPVEDLQNVHDSKLNADLLKALDKIRATTIRAPNQQTNNEIMTYIADSDLSEDKKIAALKTLENISDNSRIEVFEGRENDILSTVWGRTKIQGNKDVAEAIVLALADASENGSTVCINGRVSRIINSLFMIDKDFTQSAAMTTKAYRDQIFHETQKIYEEKLAAAPKSEAHAVVIAEYKGAELAPDTPAIIAAREEIAAELKRDIIANINKYSDKFTAPEIDKIRAEALVII